ncbi:MAG: hypothetical protein EA392_01545 [Cryomorphaceae bacterium]|nr:MAG: hypothetical protein EA392_01545 [Cryomorphaceae bacterium]
MINTGYHNYEGIARIEFDTLRGKEVKCTISRIFQQQAAPLQIFKAVGNPLTISMLGGEDTFRTIKGSEATLRVHNVENFAALGLLAKGNKDYTLTVEYESQVIWRGFMQPDQWNEPFNATPYPSEFRFIDGLSLLKELPFADADGCYFRGYFRDFQIIGYCLSQIGLRRNFVDQINLIDQNTDSADIAGTLFEKIKNVEAFRGMSCYDVIENILKSYGARIEYANEKYYIRRIDSSGNERSVRYDIPPNSFPIIVEGTVENFVEEITCANEPEPTRISWLNSTQELFRLPGVKTLKINQDYGVKPSIFPRSGFEECDFDSNGNLRYWTSNGIRKRTVEGETVVEFREWVRPPSGPGPYTPPAFIEAFTDTPYSGEGNVSAATGDLFEIDFVFRNVNYQAFDAGRYRSPRRPSLVLNTSPR